MSPNQLFVSKEQRAAERLVASSTHMRVTTSGGGPAFLTSRRAYTFRPFYLLGISEMARNLGEQAEALDQLAEEEMEVEMDVEMDGRHGEPGLATDGASTEEGPTLEESVVTHELQV